MWKANITGAKGYATFGKCNCTYKQNSNSEDKVMVIHVGTTIYISPKICLGIELYKQLEIHHVDTKWYMLFRFLN